LTAQISNSSDIIFGTGRTDIIDALAGDDEIYGFDGNDVLDGGTGADTMEGGPGSDTFVVDDVGDVVVEQFPWEDNGLDTVETSLATYELGENVEKLTGTNATGQSLSGNGLANKIVAGIGSDILVGGGGDDELAGGSGSDTFFFGAGFGHDVIDDFAAGSDIIQFGDGLFDDFSDVLNASSEVGGGVLINLDFENSLTLRDIQIANLTQSDFSFV
jgi:Ca2+-binding RTX toxin-like protein